MRFTHVHVPFTPPFGAHLALCSEVSGATSLEKAELGSVMVKALCY
jgi:hypothetical protein